MLLGGKWCGFCLNLYVAWWQMVRILFKSLCCLVANGADFGIPKVRSSTFVKGFKIVTKLKLFQMTIIFVLITIK